MLDTQKVTDNATRLLKNAFEDSKHDIIEDLRGILRNTTLTFKYISEHSGVGANTISRWENGETKSPQLLKVLAVANVLGYDLMLVKRRTH